MSIKRYISEKDNTISTAFRSNLTSRASKANMGSSDILEIFSIFGQASSGSLEQARALIQFPVVSASLDRANGVVPASGSTSFYIKMFNCPHGQTAPENYGVSVQALVRPWDEGPGLDMESYLDLESSNWISASLDTPWHSLGSDYITSEYVVPTLIPTSYNQAIVKGVEDVSINITGLTEEWIKYSEGNATASTGIIEFLNNPSHKKAAVATITVQDAGGIQDQQTFVLVDSTGLSTTYKIDAATAPASGGGSTGTAIVGIQGIGGGEAGKIALASAINIAINQTTDATYTSVSNGIDTVTVTQGTLGTSGNKENQDSLSSTTVSHFLNGLDDQTIRIYSHEGQKFEYTFINTTTYSIGNSVFLQLSGTKEQTLESLKNRIDSDFEGKIITNLDSSTLNMTQSVSGLHGNTIISSSIDSTIVNPTSFSGGTGMPNYGVVLRLQDVYEDGSKKSSFYTKKFFSRSSHEFFKKPTLEAQWDSSIKDDRASVVKSSPLAPDSDNINKIYHYNKINNALVDIPNLVTEPTVLGSHLVVSFVKSTGASLETVTGPLLDLSTVNNTISHTSGSGQYIAAKKSSTGIYKAEFSYSGDETSLYDIWSKRTITGASKLDIKQQTSGASGNTAITISASDAIGFTSDFATFVSGSDDPLSVSTATLRLSKKPINGNHITLTDNGSPATTFGFIFQTNTDTFNDVNNLVGGKMVVGIQSITTAFDALTRLKTAITTKLDIESEGPNLDTSTDIYTQMFTGSIFQVGSHMESSYNTTPQYVANITNLKESYNQDEHATFRVYTRNKNWKPNIYTKAIQEAPVNNIKDMFYKIVRVSDTYEVVAYSTSSNPSYSSLSYDSQGSYFDLDMSLLEKNNAYQISFLFKQGSNYIELPEKFRFRVDP